MPDRVAACPIWGTPAIYEENRGVSIICGSPRAGGRYWIGNQAVEVLKYKDEVFKVRLTSWLVDKRKAGDDCPKVYGHDLGPIAERNRLSMKARALRAVWSSSVVNYPTRPSFSSTRSRWNGKITMTPGAGR